MVEQPPQFNDDRPITRADEDQFGRKKIAAGIADDLLVGGSMASAVVGPWGSGKTSVLNLVKARLDEHSEKVVVVEFNPWLYSGTNELVMHFFDQLAAELRTRDDATLRRAADQLESYADLLSPFSSLPIAGGVVGRAARLIGGAAAILGRKAKFGSKSVHVQRQAIEAALAEADCQFVIVIDDLDRLEQADIRDVVRLVRLVADFPRTSYLLAFDRQRVEKALGFGDIDLGRDYLEKIIQVLYPLPPASARAVASMAFKSIDAAIEGMSHGPLNDQYWGNVQALVVRPLLRTPRDARRYANAVRSAVRDLGTEINLVDLLALEAFRVLMPVVWDRLCELVVPLTTTSSGFIGGGDQYGTKRAEYKQALVDLVAAGGDRQAAVEALLEWLFPASKALATNTNYGPDWAQRWRAERRVASQSVFAIYLARTLPTGELPTPVIDAVFDAFADAEQLAELLTVFDDDRLGQLLERLEDFEPSYPADPTEAIVALQNLLPRLPKRGAKIFEFDEETRLHRVVLRLLRNVNRRSRRDEIVRAVLPRVSGLSGRLWLIFIAGDRKSVGSKLISSSAQAEFESALRTDVKAASMDSLAQERDLLRLLDFVAEPKAAEDVAFVRAAFANDAALTRVLQAASSVTTSHTFGEVVARQEAVLAWDWLTSFLPEPELIRRIGELPEPASDAVDPEADAVRLAKRYAAGWRPRPFGSFGTEDEDETEEDEDETQANQGNDGLDAEASGDQSADGEATQAESSAGTTEAAPPAPAKTPRAPSPSEGSGVSRETSARRTKKSEEPA